MSTLPLPAHVFRNDAEALTEEESESIGTVARELRREDFPNLYLMPFLHDAEWDEDEVVSRVRRLLRELDGIGTVPLADVIGYMRRGDEHDPPPPCGVLLEDGHGGCARDKQGNPLVLVYGTCECTTESAMRQLVFITQRVKRYIGPAEIPHVSYIFDMAPRAGLHDFVRHWNVHFMRFVALFPRSFSLYMVGAPPRTASVLSFIPQWLKARMTISPSYDVLHDAIDVANMLPAWHPEGTFDFELSAYTSYLASSSA